ncbi:hypothetical protein FAZ95_36280 [Trinickia violacea]|uniref:Rloe protein n=1 Tax=Trinickia violacea TaxID=2571746 RepID=A0A4P8J0T4_9BURK|nr:DUF6037 family protein [Trinickia violacea]QCP54396.1 hypothetical protein FAZ95_36280 [Trinickia violacea]
MGIRLAPLERLYRNMQSQGMTKTQFEFRFRQLTFNVIYLAEAFPHELLLGCREHNLFIVVKVPWHFTIATYLRDQYTPLMDALGLQPNPDNPFSTNIFFEAFRAVIPTTTSKANEPTITDIAANRRDVEESEKIYFVGWMQHDGKQSSPTKANLEKTRRLCGQAVYELCLRNHISSRWTDRSDDAWPFSWPTV